MITQTNHIISSLRSGKNFKPILIILFFIMAMTIMLNLGCYFSTANLSDPKVCLDPGDGECSKDMAEISSNADMIYSTIKLNNAPEKTKITITWNYLEEDPPYEIDSLELYSKDNTSFVTTNLSRPYTGWPKGKYEVIYELDSDNSEPVKKEFSIK
jgi:hypothetical protein